MKSMVEIAGNRYEVRRRGESREIKVEGVWMDAIKWADRVASEREKTELFLLGLNRIRRKEGE